MPIQSYADPFTAASDLAALYDEERDDNADTGVFAGGVESGAYGLRSSFNDALAAGARAVGADTFAAGRERAADELAQRAAGAGHMIPAFEDIDSVGKATDWTTGLVGQNLPLLAGMTATGVLGRLGGAAALGRRGLAKAASRNAQQKALAELASEGMNANPWVQRAGAKASENVYKQSILKSAVDEALNGRSLPTRIGQTLGVGAPYLGATTGETYQTLRNDPEATGTLQDRGQAALLAGLGQTGLGMVFEPLTVAQRIHRASKAAKLLGPKYKGLGPLATLGVTSVGEGATEAGEQAIQQFTQRQFNPNAEYDPMELLEAGIGGAIIGGTYAAPSVLAGAAQRALPQRDEPAPESPVANILSDLDDNLQQVDELIASNEAAPEVIQEAINAKTELVARRALILGRNKDELGLSDEDLDEIRFSLSDELMSLGEAPQGNPEAERIWARKAAVLQAADKALSREQPNELVEFKNKLDDMASYFEENGLPVPVGLAKQRQDVAERLAQAGTAQTNIVDDYGYGADPSQPPIDYAEEARQAEEDYTPPEVPEYLQKYTQEAPTLSEEELAAAYELDPTQLEDTGPVEETPLTPQEVVLAKKEYDLLSKKVNETAKATGEVSPTNAERLTYLREQIAQSASEAPIGRAAYANQSEVRGVKIGENPETKEPIVDENVDLIVGKNAANEEEVAGKLDGFHPTGKRAFINAVLLKNLVANNTVADYFKSNESGALAKLGVEPEAFVEAITEDKPTADLARFIYKRLAQPDMAYVSSAGRSATKEGIDSTIATATFKALTDKQKLKLGLIEDLTELPSELSRLLEIDPGETGRYSLDTGENGYSTVVDWNPGDRQPIATLEYPTDILNGIVKKLPFFLNGEEIPRGKIDKLIVDSIYNREPLSAANLIASAKYAHEFRRTPIQRGRSDSYL